MNYFVITLVLAEGAKAAAEPARRVAIASFMVVIKR